MNSSQLDRLEVARRLRSLATEFVFNRRQPASRSDGVVSVSIDRQWDEENEHHGDELLVTVSVGCPPSPEVKSLPWTVREAENGMIVRVGQTDQRGQFWLSGLATADYLLEFEGIAAEPASAEVKAEFAAALAADEVPRQDFHSADESLLGCLRVTAAGRFVLEVELREADNSYNVARFRLWDAENQVLATGFLGLHQLDEGTLMGEIDLDRLDATIRSRSSGCRVQVIVQSATDLRARDRGDLERSLAATDHPRGQEALQAALTAIGGQEDSSTGTG